MSVRKHVNTHFKKYVDIINNKSKLYTNNLLIEMSKKLVNIINKPKLNVLTLDGPQCLTSKAYHEANLADEKTINVPEYNKQTYEIIREQNLNKTFNLLISQMLNRYPNTIRKFDVIYYDSPSSVQGNQLIKPVRDIYNMLHMNKNEYLVLAYTFPKRTGRIPISEIYPEANDAVDLTNKLINPYIAYAGFRIESFKEHHYSREHRSAQMYFKSMLLRRDPSIDKKSIKLPRNSDGKLIGYYFD